mmetsp:Transcript_5799/g.7141  ORF Transcript_5799/g.7141 Transcript_5799/m.7141 type:complete len:96 (-) Transcript_5799:160-447(-)|eukprot:CAMPEP_0203635226 /NCGR_PEP_ID=MMETSP0088-20131115/2051_1 /ASSEMBLY_ACC=CAM_ASM_001087 /TAXON_ID=426623 /ORGANISM="Chaetoceros affinis, Strain CCMP159" /LENGTH=95 /DNA_ID=CAMNT_0050489039 /DNA_START=281 /DNA_END=568 /DNA_ORIENTATION=+
MMYETGRNQHSQQEFSSHKQHVGEVSQQQQPPPSQMLSKRHCPNATPSTIISIVKLSGINMIPSSPNTETVIAMANNRENTTRDGPLEATFLALL